MSSKKTDTWLSSNNALRGILTLALAVALTAGAALLDAFRSAGDTSISAGLSSFILALTLIMVLLLGVFWLAQRISACKAGMSRFVSHCEHIDVDTLTEIFEMEPPCPELEPLYRDTRSSPLRRTRARTRASMNQPVASVSFPAMPPTNCAPL